jgi:hypothetical protein
MLISSGIDKLMRSLRTAPLQGSLAGEPGQSVWPEGEVPVEVDNGAVTTSEATLGERLLAAAASASSGSAPSQPAPDRVGDTSPDVVTPEIAYPEPSPTGDLETEAGPSAAPTAAAESADHRADLDVHVLTRLEAAADLVESLGLGFHLGGAVERIACGASEGKDGVRALQEASWLIERYIALLDGRPLGADLHAASVRLERAGEAIAGLRAISTALEGERAFDSAVPTRQGIVVTEMESEITPPPPVEREPTPVPEVAPNQRSFGYEVALMAARWSIMVVAVIAIVLGLTLIGEWF